MQRCGFQEADGVPYSIDRPGVISILGANAAMFLSTARYLAYSVEDTEGSKGLLGSVQAGCLLLMGE